MINSNSLISRINNRMVDVSDDANIDDAITCHYTILNRMYLTNPLYFKVILKANRFVIMSAMLAFYFTTSNPSFKDIKKFCIKNDLLSSNALDSFISFLRVAGRLKVTQDKNDKRKLNYKPTQKKLDESFGMISSILLPYGVIYPELDVDCILKDSSFMPAFFKVYSELIFSEIFVYDVIPDCREFVARDGGHMIMLNLYMESLKQKKLDIQYNYFKASIKCAVSRSHIKRCLQVAEEENLLSLREGGKIIELTPRFVNMVKRYFSFYLATVEYAFLGME